jgi:hypothetical protein
MRPRTRSAEAAAVLRSFGTGGTRRRLIPVPANDNTAPLGIRVARSVALLVGVAVISWIVSRLLSA